MTGTRIPFALIGVLLLVGSATYAGSLQTPTASEPAVDDALAEAGAETQSAVRDGVSTAARAAARNPVTSPAETPAGAVLNETATFRDSLRVRVYLAVRDRLARLSGSEGGLAVTASLPATETAAALRAAKRRVTIERAGANGTALRATVENVTLTASRDGRAVGTRTVSPTVTVPVPTLFVHDRVREFEALLDAGPGEPGLGRRVTGPLYALTWVRGYAQFGGAPIANVIANRHVGLFANSAVLSMQRDFFGHSDQHGRSMLKWATANTALTDVVDATNHSAADVLSTLHDDIQGERAPAVILQHERAGMPNASPDDEVTVGINETADRAFLTIVDDLPRLRQQPYRVDIRRRNEVTRASETTLDHPRSPKSDWRLLDVSVNEQTTVSERSGRPVAVTGAWHRLSVHHRWVNRTWSVQRTWQTQSGTQETVERRRRAHAVRIALAGRHDGGDAPERPLVAVHRRGGPLDGPNLADIERKARRSLLEQQGGIDGIARQTVESGDETVTESVLGDRPSNLSEWVYRDLVSLRERIGNISVTVPKGQLATMQVNPTERLRERLEAHRETLLDHPPTYEGVASRARAVVRHEYFERVYAHLLRRELNHTQRRAKLGNALGGTDVGSLETLQTRYQNRDSSPSSRGRAGVEMRVNTAPSYLTLGAVAGDDIVGMPDGTTEHPLVVQNRNLFTVPYGDAADAIVDTALGADRARIQTAAEVLGSAVDIGIEPAVNRSGDLREHVTESNTVLKTTAVETLATVANRSVRERAIVVDAALSQWDVPHAVAEAVSNGSAAEAIRTEATRRWNLSYSASDRLGLALERNLAAMRTTDAVRPPQRPVAEHADTVQRLAVSRLTGALEDKAKDAVKQSIEKRLGRSLSRLPAGLPVAPVPPYWFATVNYWEIRIAGEYAQFAVSVPRGTADEPGGKVTYVRDGRPVTLDVDGDGSAEKLGAGSRVSFETHTSVAIAVPPRPRGVGDINGQMNETSPGWPTPGDGES